MTHPSFSLLFAAAQIYNEWAVSFQHPHRSSAIIEQQFSRLQSSYQAFKGGKAKPQAVVLKMWTEYVCFFVS